MNELTVAYLQMLLRELAEDQSGKYTPEMQQKRMMQACVFLLDSVTGNK